MWAVTGGITLVGSALLLGEWWLARNTVIVRVVDPMGEPITDAAITTHSHFTGLLYC
jgi:hypothetical protein